jgi:uncharacterized protein with HEPN domain
MIERVISPRLADIVEAIERIHRVLDGVPLEAFEQDWEKRWSVERGIEIISESSRHLSDEIKTRQAEIPARLNECLDDLMPRQRRARGRRPRALSR